MTNPSPTAVLLLEQYAISASISCATLLPSSRKPLSTARKPTRGGVKIDPYQLVNFVVATGRVLIPS